MANFGVTVAESAIKRIKELYELTTDTEVADLLKVSRQSLYKWKQRGTIDLVAIKEALPKLSIDWLLYGQGNPYIDNMTTNKPIITDIFDIIDISFGN